jgi:hypothetical protein
MKPTLMTIVLIEGLEHKAEARMHARTQGLNRRA